MRSGSAILGWVPEPWGTLGNLGEPWGSPGGALGEPWGSPGGALGEPWEDAFAALALPSAHYQGGACRPGGPFAFIGLSYEGAHRLEAAAGNRIFRPLGCRARALTSSFACLAGQASRRPRSAVFAQALKILARPERLELPTSWSVVKTGAVSKPFKSDTPNQITPCLT